MENENNNQGPRLILFVLLSSLLLFGYPMLMKRFFGQPQVAQQQKDEEKPKGDASADKAKQGAVPAADKTAPPPDAAKVAEPAPVAPAKEEPEQWAALGSADPASGYRMLVTFTNRGGAVERIELNHPRYNDITHRETVPGEDHSGWVGHIAEIAHDKDKGCLARVVGRGTPLEQAGLKSGDVITQIDGRSIANDIEYRSALRTSRPGKTLTMTVQRGGKSQEFKVVARQRPVKLVQAEHLDPLSYLLTLDALDGRTIESGADELQGIGMRTGTWQMAATDDEVTFTWPLAAQGLEIVKRFRLAKAPPDQIGNLDYKAFHLELSVELRNRGSDAHVLAYRLDGPTGLPIEGSWYAQKISREWWDSAGMRDAVGGFRTGPQSAYRKHELVSCDKIVKNGEQVLYDDEPVTPPVVYAGVDALYFASTLVPIQDKLDEQRFAKALAVRVGKVPDQPADRKLTNVSCRLVSQTITLEPGAELKHEFQVFAGPKRPNLLSEYGMELINYGWPIFSWTAKPLLWLLHFFHDYLLHNYGLAIIMLTVVVRSCMFPISRKQALNAQKMQELQPEIKKLTEKYKNDMEKRARAQQELFAKHHYHPLSGCLPVFLQLPIFIGLYRSLALDVELRNSSLIPGLNWCSNLCAPDMLWYWERSLPAFFAAPHGWLGPYLNILPLVTVGLFLYQQKKMMPAPDPSDEQAVMQQKVMTYMMIFMGLMFFKVASGLCIYFIASSLWSVAERKLLPKKETKSAGAVSSSKVIDVTATGNGSDRGSRPKARDRR